MSGVIAEPTADMEQTTKSGAGPTGPAGNLGRKMMRKTLIAKRWAMGTAASALVFSLAACEQIQDLDLPFLQRDDATSESNLDIPTGETETRDVEAPDIFQKNEAGLWDGRPSLGGVWVAHPDVTDPERVIIRNEDNGQFVVGALFRRERDNPGPALQVSSDAAEELGMQAGTPANLNVVALRREEAPVGDLPETDLVPFDNPLDDGSGGLAAPDSIDATPLDPIAGAAAAIDAAEANTEQAPFDTATVTPIEPIGAPLDARAPDAMTASVPLPAPADALPVPAPTATSTLEKPFIQIGIFSLEPNANETAAKLRNDGMAATVLAQESQGKPFWRVLVGPAPNAQDRTAILAKIQALGFSDAYFVSN